MYKHYKDAMKVHIVFVHESHKSFNGALLDVAVKALKDAKHEVTISDLYAMKFNAVASQADIRDGVKNKDAYDYHTEMKGAYTRGTLAADIAVEHRKIEAADLVIFQFPLQWYTYPAILKGYIDRVFTNGFAFSYAPEFKIFDKGPFTKKRAIISLTTGGYQSTYTPAGLHGDFSVFTWPMVMTLRHMGFQVLAPHISWSVKAATEDQRKALLKSWGERVAGVWTEQPLSFFSLDDFDMGKGLQFKDDVIEKAKKSGKAPNIGQHLGLPQH